jgi:hypothetical protein
MATPKKKVANTLKTILENPVMQQIQDKGSDITELIDTVDGYWKYDLLSRKPSPAAYDDAGNLLQTTNLDLSTFLYALWDRGANINIPIYKGWRPKSTREGEVVVSKNNRHGRVTGLVANKDLFSFNIRIIDANVMTTDGTGFPRNFSLTDPNGDWYEGWRTIQFLPTAEENKWLTESKIWDSHKIVFDNFVNPNRWISFFGQYYFMTKAMIARLKTEKSHLTAIKKRMEANGISLPESSRETFPEYAKSEREEGKSIKFETVEVEIDIPEAEGEFRGYEDSQENLIEIYTRLRKIRLGQEKLMFSARCIEYAVHSQNRFDSFPTWLENVQWEEDHKTGPRSRTKWRRLKLVQPGVAQKSVAIRYRVKEKSETVAKHVTNKSQPALA